MLEVPLGLTSVFTCSASPWLFASPGLHLFDLLLGQGLGGWENNLYHWYLHKLHVKLLKPTTFKPLGREAKMYMEVLDIVFLPVQCSVLSMLSFSVPREIIHYGCWCNAIDQYHCFWHWRVKHDMCSTNATAPTTSQAEESISRLHLMIYPRPWLTYRYFFANLVTQLFSAAEKDSQSTGYHVNTGTSSPRSRSFNILVASLWFGISFRYSAGRSRRWCSVRVSRTIQILDTKQSVIQKLWVQGIPYPCPRSALGIML